MILTSAQEAEFRMLSHTMVAWLNANCNPHVSVIVTPVGAELLEGVCTLHTEEHIQD